MASFVSRGEQFSESEVTLIDLDEERLRVVETLARKMAHARGLDLTIRQPLTGAMACATPTPSSPASAQVASRRVTSTRVSL